MKDVKSKCIITCNKW